MQQKNLTQELTLDDSKNLEWKGVHLPHTPRVEHKEFTTHWQGVSWYRKQFFAQKKWQGKRIVIKFEAVMQVCTPPNATYSTKFLSINCGSRNLSPDVFVSLMFCIT